MDFAQMMVLVYANKALLEKDVNSVYLNSLGQHVNNNANAQRFLIKISVMIQ